MSKEKRRKKILLLLYLLPFLLFVMLFSYVPLFGWTYAFFDFSPGLPISQLKFVGLKYFALIFNGATDFVNVLVNTLAISLLGLVCSVAPVIFAIMVTQMRVRWLSKLVQTISSIPNFISWVLVYAIFFSMFSTNDGVVNQVLLNLHLIKEPVDVLGNVPNAWYVQTLVGIWKGTGWGAIIYLASIAGIDTELYDASDVDGANRRQKIIHITLPGIASTYLVLLLLAIANILSNGFEQYWVFQNALTREKLEVFDTYVYRLGMINMQYSFSTAMGIFKSVISVLLLTLANFVSKIIRGQSII